MHRQEYKRKHHFGVLLFITSRGVYSLSGAKSADDDIYAGAVTKSDNFVWTIDDSSLYCIIDCIRAETDDDEVDGDATRRIDRGQRTSSL